jgi:hypothetical protein
MNTEAANNNFALTQQQLEALSMYVNAGEGSVEYVDH